VFCVGSGWNAFRSFVAICFSHKIIKAIAPLSRIQIERRIDAKKELFHRKDSKADFFWTAANHSFSLCDLCGLVVPFPGLFPPFAILASFCGY